MPEVTFLKHNLQVHKRSLHERFCQRYPDRKWKIVVAQITSISIFVHMSEHEIIKYIHGLSCMGRENFIEEVIFFNIPIIIE